MSDARLTNDEVMVRSARARAAVLAARYTGDERKENLAEEELDRLAKVNFSAMSAGRDLVDRLIEDGFDVVINASFAWWPFEMTGMAVGRGDEAARQALLDLWGPELDNHLGLAPSLAEGQSLILDLNAALEDYTLYKLSPSPPKPPWWKKALYSLRPASLTIGVSAPVRMVAKWQFRKRDE